MESVGREGRTVLFVSHQMSMIENLCKTAILMNAGKIICFSNVKEVISQYMSFANDTSFRSSLEANSYRTGNGNMRFTDFHVEDLSGNKVSFIQSGQDIVLVFKYSSFTNLTLKNINIGFGIHSNSGERLTVLYTSYSNQEFDSVPFDGEFRCLIRRFPFSPGRYYFFPRIEINGYETDFPRDGVGFINVESGDFFGTGRMIGDRGNAPFLITGDWSVCDINNIHLSK